MLSTRAMVRTWELPPHTRRRELCGYLGSFGGGTTSAYAEKSKIIFSKSKIYWNYLRIRGEEPHRNPHRFVSRELPPHTRRRESHEDSQTRLFGTTSAYAEKRNPAVVVEIIQWNYLRIRGEEKSSPQTLSLA